MAIYKGLLTVRHVIPKYVHVQSTHFIFAHPKAHVYRRFQRKRESSDERGRGWAAKFFFFINQCFGIARQSNFLHS